MIKVFLMAGVLPEVNPQSWPPVSIKLALLPSMKSKVLLLLRV
jgi:hypothetical protein